MTRPVPEYPAIPAALTDDRRTYARRVCRGPVPDSVGENSQSASVQQVGVELLELLESKFILGLFVLDAEGFVVESEVFKHELR